jgi:hypothetical protein
MRGGLPPHYRIQGPPRSHLSLIERGPMRKELSWLVCEEKRKQRCDALRFGIAGKSLAQVAGDCSRGV